MNRKNILALISLVLVMVFVLSACGKAGNVSEAKTPESQALAFHTEAELKAPAMAPAEAEVEEEGWGSVPYIQNDTVVRGEYTPFVPMEDAESFSGVAIEGNAEEELQQERIAGGAVGQATSVVEELHGITDYSEGEYVPVYGD